MLTRSFFVERLRAPHPSSLTARPARSSCFLLGMLQLPLQYELYRGGTFSTVDVRLTLLALVCSYSVARLVTYIHQKQFC